jgi:hypothetical protein
MITGFICFCVGLVVGAAGLFYAALRLARKGRLRNILAQLGL